MTYHRPPLVFDLSRDPSESRPLAPDTEPWFSEVLEQVERAVTEHPDAGGEAAELGEGAVEALASALLWDLPLLLLRGAHGHGEHTINTEPQLLLLYLSFCSCEEHTDTENTQ